MQKLVLLNGPFILDRAKALAARLEAGPGEGDRERVRRAYLLLFAREPEEEEADLALKFLRGPAGATASLSRWGRYAQILLASNEMWYVD